MDNSKIDCATYIVYRIIAPKLIELRHEILRPGFPPASASFEGDDDPLSWHMGAFEFGPSEKLLSCASFLPSRWYGKPALRLRGMATRTNLQGKGIGTTLLQESEDMIVEHSETRLFWCDARESAISFYEKLGWAIASDVFEIETVGPHRKMVKQR